MRITSVIAAVTLAITASFVGTPASATPKVSKADVEYVRASMEKYGVPQKAQNRLIREFISGKRWDSQGGAEPASTEVTRAGAVERTIYRYADGSVNVSEMDIPTEVFLSDGEIAPYAINGCQKYTKAGANA